MEHSAFTWTSVFADEAPPPSSRRLKIKAPKGSVDDAREFGGWTMDKLTILQYYLKMYRRVAGNGTYIDAFAGTGQVRIGEMVQSGSAAIALDSGAFKQFRFHELPDNAAKLEHWVQEHVDERRRSRTVIVRGDVNETLVQNLDAGVIDRGKPCFAFLDPTSTQLAWSTVQALAAYKSDCDPPKTCKVELWILFNTDQALMRLVPKTGRPPFIEVLNRWIGDEDGWRDLYEQSRSPGAFAERYADRLMTRCGYSLARSLPICDPVTNRRQYYMIHASDHPAAHSFMRWAAKRAHPDGSEAVAFPGVRWTGP